MNKPLKSLIHAARKATPIPPPPQLDTPPLGFATRIAARWTQTPSAPRNLDLLERLGWWAAAASIAVCLITFTQRSSHANPFDPFMEEQDSTPLIP